MKQKNQDTAIAVTVIILLLLLAGVYNLLLAAKKKSQQMGLNAALAKIENAAKQRDADRRALEMPAGTYGNDAMTPETVEKVIGIIGDIAIPTVVPTGAKKTKVFEVTVKQPNSTKMLPAKFQLAFENDKAVGWYTDVEDRINGEPIPPQMKQVTWLVFSPYNKAVLTAWEANKSTIGYE